MLGISRIKQNSVQMYIYPYFVIRVVCESLASTWR